MTSDDDRLNLMAYLDGEMSPPDKARFEQRLADSPQLQEELARFRRLSDELAAMAFPEPSDVELDRFWKGVYNRMERWVAWAVLLAGLGGALCYGAFHAIRALISDPQTALLVKVAVVAVLVGLVTLFLSLFRERLAVYKSDRYSREVQR